MHQLEQRLIDIDVALLAEFEFQVGNNLIALVRVKVDHAGLEDFGRRIFVPCHFESVYDVM